MSFRHHADCSSIRCTSAGITAGRDYFSDADISEILGLLGQVPEFRAKRHATADRVRVYQGTVGGPYLQENELQNSSSGVIPADLDTEFRVVGSGTYTWGSELVISILV